MSEWESIRVRRELLDRLKVAAKEQDRSVASLADLLLTLGLDIESSDHRHYADRRRVA